jgi:hypothetical protein
MRASTSTSNAMTTREYCYGLPNHLMLTVAQGSVLEFAAEKGAIVNAANEVS